MCEIFSGKSSLKTGTMSCIYIGTNKQNQKLLPTKDNIIWAVAGMLVISARRKQPAQKFNRLVKQWKRCTQGPKRIPTNAMKSTETNVHVVSG